MHRLGKIVIAALVLLLSGCSNSSNPDTITTLSKQSDLTVFAASSLRTAFVELEPAPTYQFAASGTLLTQIIEGAQIDVFASADTKNPDELYKQGLSEKPVLFATNHLVLVVPKSSPITKLSDLRKPNVSFVIAENGVPLGNYTEEVLKDINYGDLIKKAQSREKDAQSVVSKVSLEEADAGIAYITDISSDAKNLNAIELPKTAKNHATYAMVIIKTSKHKKAAQDFVSNVTSSSGQKVLEKYGFGAS